jgi:predicted DNA-binding antitoxin AbrB/MazE fold protein
MNMIHEIDAIYDQGVFRPIAPVRVTAGARVHLRVEEESREPEREGVISSYAMWLDHVSGSWKGDFVDDNEGDFEARESLS